MILVKFPQLLFCIAGLLIAVFRAEAQTSAESPQSVKCGIFINRINSFDVKSGVAEIDFWLWLTSENPKLSIQNLELSNGELEKIGDPICQSGEELYYVSQRCVARAKCRVAMARFPFDEQQIILSFEDSESTADLLTFIPDGENSGIDPAFAMNEWEIETIEYQTGIHNYPTSFGYLDIPSGQGSDYAQFIVEITVSRRGSLLQKSFKYFWAVAVSVIVGLFSLLIQVCELDARFGMAVGALFANVGCSFLLADQLPQAPCVSIAEKVSYVSLGAIMIILMESIFSLAIHKKINERISRRLDLWAFFTLMIGYTTVWFFIL